MSFSTKPGGGGGLASTGAAPVGTTDVNLIEVLGVAVLTGGLAGSQGVGGLAARNAAAAGNPNLIGGVYDAAPADLDDGDAGTALIDIKGRLILAGDVADDAAEGSAAPAKVGGVASLNPLADSVDDGDVAKLITDLERFLRVRSRAYNPLTDSDKVENQNLISDDYDSAAQVLANVTDQAAARTNYPSDTGQPIDSRNRLGIIVGMRDGEFDFEVSNGDGNWVIATKTLIDVNAGSGGYTAAGHYTEPDAATVYFGVTWADLIEFSHFRLAFTPPNATSIFTALLMTRAN
jgi:hypothetical protein